MAKFDYKAVNPSGKSEIGEIEASSVEAAREALAARGLIPKEVMQQGAVGKKGSGKSIFDSVSVPDLILFTKQFRTMFSAGISIVRILEILIEQTENKCLQRVTSQIAEDIRVGASIYQAFGKHPKIFSPLYLGMLRAGEVSGTLPEVLDRLIYIIQHDYKVTKDIKSALTYPAVVIVALFGAFLFLLTAVVPQFARIFASANIELPLPTQLCIGLYELLKAYWPYISVVSIVLIGGLILFFRTERGKFVRDTILLRLPILGPVFKKGAMSRFASIFAILQSSGVTVLDAIRILTDTIGNSAISAEFDDIREKLEQGRGISGPLRQTKYFPPLVVNMIAIGEESGNIDTMLREVAEHYDYEVEYAIGRMSELIGPVLMVALAGVVGFFALAIFMPMWDMTKTAGL